MTKDVKQFKKINLNEIGNKIEDNKIQVNTKESNTFIQKNKNSTIWSIYKNNQETLLSNIAGNQFIHPIDKIEEEDFKESMKNSLLQLPSKGIPDNPKEQKIIEMKKEDMDKLQKDANVKETGYSFSSNIFGD